MQVLPFMPSLKILSAQFVADAFLANNAQAITVKDNYG